jgi:hypothetical protein
LPEETHVRAEAQVADAGRGDARVGDAADGARVAVLVRRDGQIEPEAHAVEEDERRPGVQDELVVDGDRARRAVGAVEHERANGELPHEADGRTKLAAQIERVHREPLAASLGRVEAIEREPARRLRQRGDRRQDGRGGEEDSDDGRARTHRACSSQGRPGFHW